MRRLILVTMLLAAVAAGAARGATVPAGWLAGKTQISFGCPGPVRQDGPPCEPWRIFPDARFAVVRIGPGGTPVAATRRVVVSDDGGAFRLRLAAGAYDVTPLRQAHTLGGAQLHVRVTAGAVTRVLVRFVGFPQMM